MRTLRESLGLTLYEHTVRCSHNSKVKVCYYTKPIGYGRLVQEVGRLHWYSSCW